MTKYRLSKTPNVLYTIESKRWYGWVCCVTHGIWGDDTPPAQMSYKNAKEHLEFLMETNIRQTAERKKIKEFKPFYLYPPLSEEEPK